MSEETSLKEIYEEWKVFYFKRIQKSTRDNYLAAWNYLKLLEDLPFKNLRTKDYQMVIDKNDHLSNSSLLKIKQLVKHICDFGMMEDYISVNYGKFLYIAPEEIKPKKIFSNEDIKKMIDCANSLGNIHNETAKITLMLIFTGFRIDELFSVKKSDVYFQDNFIIGGNKTKAGKNRIIPISQFITDYIFYFYSKKQSNTNESYLLETVKGKKTNVDKWRRKKFYPFMEYLGINSKTASPLIKPHATRHTAATIMNKAGMNPDKLIKIIGHSNFEFTNNVYIHNGVEELQLEIDKLDKMFCAEL